MKRYQITLTVCSNFETHDHALHFAEALSVRMSKEFMSQTYVDGILREPNITKKVELVDNP